MRQTSPLIAALWSQHRLRLIMIAVLLLLVVAAYLVQTWIVDPQLLGLRTEQSQLQQHVRQRQAEFTSSGVPVSTTEQIAKNLERFNRLVPSKTDFSVFIGELFAWSKQAGLEIHQISYQPGLDEETGFLRYGLSFSVKGDYSQVKKFLHLLENAPRILLVEKLSLVGSSQAAGDNSVDLRIELATYFQETV